MHLSFSTSCGDLILSFPKDLISSKYISRFIERLEMEKIAQKSLLSEENAWRLSEEIKESWWNRNRDRFLKKIKDKSNS